MKTTPIAPQRLQLGPNFIQRGELNGQLAHLIFLSEDLDPTKRLQPFLLTDKAGVTPYEEAALKALDLAPHPELLDASKLLDIPGAVLLANRYDGHIVAPEREFDWEASIARCFEELAKLPEEEAVFFEVLVLLWHCLCLVDHLPLIDVRGLQAIQRSVVKRLLIFFAPNGIEADRVPSQAWEDLAHYFKATLVLEPLTRPQQEQCLGYLRPFLHGGVQPLPATYVPLHHEAFISKSRFAGVITFNLPTLTDELSEQVLTIRLSGQPGVFRPLSLNLHVRRLMDVRNTGLHWVSRNPIEVLNALAHIDEPELLNADGFLWAGLMAVASVRDKQCPEGRYLTKLKALYKRSTRAVQEAHEPADKRILIGFLHYLAGQLKRVGPDHYHNVHEIQDAINGYWGANYARNHISAVLRQMDIFVGSCKRSVIPTKGQLKDSAREGSYVLGPAAIRAWCAKYQLECPLDSEPTSQAEDVLNNALQARQS